MNAGVAGLIILPLVAPVIKDLGINMVWFLVVMAVMLQTSFLTPPVGFSLFYLKGVVPKEITTRHIYVGIIPSSPSSSSPSSPASSGPT